MSGKGHGGNRKNAGRPKGASSGNKDKDKDKKKKSHNKSMRVVEQPQRNAFMDKSRTLFL
jgi:hypothetical protein